MKTKVMYLLDYLSMHGSRYRSHTEGVKAMTVIKLNDYAELHVSITDEMKKDYAECGAKARIPGGECKDCDTCSLQHTVCLEHAFCEIPKIKEILKK